MTHLTDDMLLAYVRRQQRNLWTPQMQAHLDICRVCQGRCIEFKATGDVLEAWARSAVSEPMYAIVSNRVMRTLYEPRTTPQGRMGHGISRVRVVLPVVSVVVLLLAILFVGFQINRASTGAPSNKVPPKLKIVVAHPTPTPIAPTPTLGPIEPIVTVSPVVTATATSLSGSPTATATAQNVPTIKIESPCTTVIDVVQNQLHVCGKNFTPGTTVLIYYHNGTNITKHTTQVGADGTFNDMLYIQSCNDVPGSVYVQSSENPPQTAQITKNITFGTCQGFGGLKKPKK